MKMKLVNSAGKGKKLLAFIKYTRFMNYTCIPYLMLHNVVKSMISDSH